MASGDTKTNQYLDIAANGTRADLPTDTCCETRTQSLIRGVAERVIGVEEEVERLENNPDVVDIVSTYQDLQNYDTSTLTDKDVIRVLTDSTHNNNSTYYRWNAATSQFDFVGEISGGSSVNVVQTTGTSTTDVMSQKATTNMVYANPNQPTSPNRSVSLGGAFAPLTLNNIGIGYRANPGGSSNAQYNICLGADSTAQSGSYGIVIGNSAYIGKNYAISIGASCGGTEVNGVSIGYRSHAVGKNAVAIGSNSIANENGQFDISSSFQGSTTGGYNNTQYRLLTGLYDPQNAHDAATKGYVDGLVGNIEAALNAINNGGN